MVGLRSPAWFLTTLVDYTFAVIGDTANREWVYVAINRRRDTNRAYLLSSDQPEQCTHLAHKGRGDPLEVAVSSLQRRERRKRCCGSRHRSLICSSRRQVSIEEGFCRRPCVWWPDRSQSCNLAAERSALSGGPELR